MKILCGTDFTPPATVALEAAAALATSTAGTLRLVHVATQDDAIELAEHAGPGAAASDLRQAVEARLREAVRRMSNPALAAETAVLGGHADEALVAEAERWGASLIVLGPLGKRSAFRLNLGSTADRVAQHATCPVLVARSAEGFAASARGERALRVVLGVDATAPSDAAARWIFELASRLRCEIVGAHVYWPPEVRDRLAIRGPLPIGAGHPKVDAALAKELEQRLESLAKAKLPLRIVGGLGRVADHLAQIAEDEKADLLAVGSHQRSILDRLWHGSISHAAIASAPMSVLSVPSR